MRGGRSGRERALRGSEYPFPGNRNLTQVSDFPSVYVEIRCGASRPLELLVRGDLFPRVSCLCVILSGVCGVEGPRIASP